MLFMPYLCINRCNAMPQSETYKQVQYTLSDLCAATGLSPRQVRDLRAKGALPPPIGKSRAAHYTEVHLARLIAIQPLLKAGVPVSRIAAQYSVESDQHSPQAPLVSLATETWKRVRVGSTVEVSVLVGNVGERRTQELLDHLAAEAVRFLASEH